MNNAGIIDAMTFNANGNPTRVENDFTAAVREMYWDEDNRLMVLYRRHKRPVQERVSQGQITYPPPAFIIMEAGGGFLLHFDFLNRHFLALYDFVFHPFSYSPK